MRMKKGKTLAIILLLSLLLSAVTVLADDNVVGFSDPSAMIEPEFEVEMWITGDIAYARIFLVYSTDYIEYLGYSGGAGNTDVRGGGGSIEITDYYSSGSGPLNYTLKFIGHKAGTTSLTARKQDSEIVGAGRVDLTEATQFYSSEITIMDDSTEPPTEAPTEAPTEPTEAPTEPPETTEAPTEPPTEAPTEPPTEAPTDPPAPVTLALSSVYFEGGELIPAFDPDVTDYTVRVPEGTTRLRYVYQLADGRATSYYWPYSEAEPSTWVFSQGEEMVIRVLTPDQSEYVDYSFVLEQPETEAPTEAPTERQPSHDAALFRLRLEGGGELSPSFDPEQLSYRLVIDPSVSSLGLLYVPRDGAASAYPNISLDNIPYGETELVIHVTAEDGYTTRDYRVTIVRPAQEAPTETDPPETTEPESTEPDTTEPDTTEPATEEPTTEAPIVLESMPLLFKILPIPEDAEIPAGYVVREMTTDEGAAYQALVPEGVRKPDHCVLYGVRLKEAEPDETEPAETEAPGEEDPFAEPDETAPPERILVEDGEPGFYVYDLKEGTLQRMGLLAEPETEAPTEPPETTEAPTEPPTEPPTTPEPTRPLPTETHQPPTSAVPATTEAERNGGSGRIPWWIFAAMAGIAGVGAYAVITLSKDKKQLEEELKTHGALSADEEKAFLSMNSGSLYSMAKETNSPWTVEDLDPVFEEQLKQEEAEAQAAAEAEAEENAEAAADAEAPAEENVEAAAETEAPAEENAEEAADAETPAEENAEAASDAETQAEESADAASDAEAPAEENTEAASDAEAPAEESADAETDAEPAGAPAEKTDKEAPEA